MRILVLAPLWVLCAVACSKDSPQTEAPRREYPCGRPGCCAATTCTGPGCTFPSADAASSSDPGAGEQSCLAAFADGPWVFPSGGAAPNALLAADVDGDGAADLISANRSSETLSILRASRSESPLPDICDTGGIRPSAVAAADVDGDETVDLIVGGDEEGKIAWLKGVQDGSFEPPVVIAAVEAVGTLGSFDVDSDGDPDLVVADIGDGHLKVLLNDGQAGFALADEMEVGTDVRNLWIGDLFSTPHPEVVLSRLLAGKLIVASLGAGGRFAGDAATFSFPGIRGFAAADLDGDSLVDLIAASGKSPDGLVVSLLNRGGGEFEQLQGARTGPSGYYGLAAADLDGDAIPDVVAASENWSAILRGRGDGGWHDPVGFAGGLVNGSVVVLDLDLDGQLDVVTAGLDNFYIHAGRGPGVPYARESYIALPDEPAFATDAAFLDVDGDGALDLVTVSTLPPALVIFRGSAASAFVRETAIELPVAPFRFVATDLDEDGVPDFAVAHRSAPGLSVLLSTGAGGWQRTGFDFEDHYYAIAAEDLDCDGHEDLIASSAALGYASIYWGKGDGSFDDAVSRLDVHGGPGDIEITDVNHDGIPDLLFPRFVGDDFWIVTNDGTRGFTLQRMPTGGRAPIALEVGQVVGDAHPDLVVANKDSGDVTVLEGLASGGYAAPVVIPLDDDSLLSLALTDTDGDGIQEIVVGSGALALLQLKESGPPELRGFGVGSFYKGSIRSLHVADVGGDGTPDIVATIDTWGTIEVIRSRCAAGE